MSYKYYNSYLTVAPATQREYWKDNLQDMKDQQFYDASDAYTIEEELTKGTLTFTDVDVRLTHIVNASTGVKLGDDFKNVIFQNSTHPKGQGYRYQFDNNVWICINTGNYKSATTSAVIRRCNNVLNSTINPVITDEPCIIDYKISNDKFDYNKNIDLNDGDISVVVQYNDITKLIKVNTKFMFGEQTFRVQSLNNFLRSDTYDNDTTPLLKMVMKIDQVNVGNDDTTNNIADNDNTLPGGW